MNARKILLSVLLVSALLGLSACSLPNLNAVRGSGNVVTEERQVSGFQSIELSGSGELLITQGDEEGLTIEAEDNMMQYLVSEVENGVLRLGYEDQPRRMYLPSEPIIFRISLIDLEGVSISGSGRLVADSLETVDLNLESSGSGNFEIANLTAERLIVELSGSGNANIAGTVTDQELQTSGTANYEAGDLQSQTAVLSISGSGNVTVWVEAMLDVDVSGSGTINYYGQPQISQDISGSGDINSLGDK